MAGQTFTLNFDAKLNVAQMKGAISSIQSELNRLQLPQNLTKGITGTLTSLEKELRNFEVAAGKDLGQKNNFSAFERSAERISSLFKDLQIQARDLGQGISLDKFFPQDVVQTINQAKTALKNYESEVDKLNRTVSSQKGQVTKALANQTVAKDNLDAAKGQLDKFASEYQQTLTDLFNRVKIDPKNIIDQASIDQAIAEAQKRIERLQQIQNNVNAKGQPYKYADSTKEKAKAEEAALTGLITKYNELREAQTQQSVTIQKLQTAYDTATNKVKAAQVALQEFENAAKAGTTDALNKLITELNKLGIDTTGVTNIEQAKAALAEFSKTAEGEAAAALEKLRGELERQSPVFDNNADAVRQSADAYRQFNDSLRDVSSVKSRIQYFFGLNNAINLIKRGIREAISTVKELDKAMTETAVVTSNTISDMWQKLPDYTKRANELGVSTLEAYQAATLYYQQGLNDDQTAALSVETLKMARIAGLEAADATDRMTNALRGFNMELNAVSAQKVDDVYSQLAAMSASNVDEISTAMTKVASLAHSANMEFETTAAFLAQIIETTRESAETAGTALKTVVARFSEVKKLYDMDELKGKDEEGQNIDVNKVSSALRTAGIDLNKYFLGEVGLDDIFMELASKWDSLTSVQQRYIATQAAGSRQQSRFIALMQDYARTQQLVSAAYNANGASAKQFEKTQESLQSKLARLKNAWDEFLMGLANNSIIKGVVDGLTTLLNIVNKLTGAFGTGAGFVLKWVTAISAFRGIKSLFKTGGFLDLAIMGGLQAGGKGALANAAVKTGLLSGLVRGGGIASILGEEAGKIAEENAGAIAQRQASRTPFLGIGGLFSNLGTKIREFKLNNQRQYFDEKGWQNWLNTDEAALMGGGLDAKGDFNKLATPKTLFGALGNKFIGTKVGSGMQGALSKLPGIGSAFTGAAAGAATLGVALAGVAAAAGLVYAAWRASPQGQLKTAQKQAEKAREEAEEAQKELNTLTSLQDTYKEKTEAINETTTVSDRAQAIKDRNDAILNAIKEDGTLAQYVITEQADNEIILRVDEAGLAKAAEEATRIAEEAAIKSYFKEANVAVKEANVARNKLEGILSGTALYDSSLIQNMSIGDIYEKILANSDIISEKQLSEAAELYSQYSSSLGTAEQQVKIAYGQQLSSLKVDDEIVNSLMPILSKIFMETGKQFNSTDLEGFAKIGKSDNGKALLKVLDGSYDEQISIDEVKEKFDSLSQEQQESIKTLLNTAGKSIEETYKALEKYAISIQKSQKEFRKKTTATLKKGGINNVALLDQISNDLKISQQKKLVEIADSLSDYGSDFSSIILTKLSEAMLDGEYDETFANFAASLSDNPILTLEALKKAAQDGNEEVKKLIESLGLIDKSGNLDFSKYQVFSKENLVQFYLASDEYDNLTESVEKFIEANGQITSNNIEELAEQSKSLQILLDNDIISANGLSNAINALSQGNVTIFDLNERVLNLFESFDSVANAISRAGDLIKNFDPGEDWGDAFDFINSGIEKMSEFVENRELGNPQLRNYWSTFFKGPAPSDLAGWESAIAILKEMQANGGADFWTKAVGFTMDANGNIADMGIEDFATSGETNYVDFIKNKAEENGYNFSDAYYDLMLRNMGNHDYGVMKEIGAVETQKIIEAYGQGAPTQADIQAIADAYNLDPQEVLDAWAEKYNNGEHIDFSKLQESIRHTTTAAKDVLEKEWKQGRRDIGDTESEINRSWETQSQDTGWVLSQLGANPDGTFSIDTLYAKIGKIVPEVADGTMSAAEWVQEQIDNSPEGEITLPVTYQVTHKTGEKDGKPTFETETIETEVTISNLQEYQAAVDQLQQAADQQMLGESLTQPLADAETKAQAISQLFAELGLQTDLSNITTQINDADTKATTLHDNLSRQVTKYVNIVPLQSSISISGKGGSVSFSISAAAKGGIVQSQASGSVNSIKPGLALTGEEAPEIVWNKEKGYAYLAGKDGPEINNLQPGDQVFNGDQTEQILKRSGISSFAKGTIGSYAGTIWKLDGPSSKSGGGSSGGSGKGSSGKDKTPEEWKNDLDWLYNLMEDIAELERDQKAIEEQYEDLLQDQTKTGGDLYRLLVKQLGNLYTQLNHQTFALEKREQEMREFMDVTNDKDQYLWYNWQDRTIEIDWDAIDRITDEEEYKHVKELIDEAEEIQDKIDDADDAIMDITNQIQELENIWRDTFVDFEDRVLDAIIKSYQQIIDNYSELNDTLNNSNTQILDSLQKQISLERQIRDNTKTEEEISDEEARLAYLRRDTSGGNELAALQLEKELADQRENYEDTLVDQAINRLQEDNDAAAQQRERQIEIMQAQLDYQSENGEFNAYISELLTTAMGADGELLTNSDLVTLLKEQENWDAMSAVSKQVWDEELNGTFKEVAAFLLKQNAEENGTFYTALTKAVEGVSSAIGSYSQAMTKLGNQIASAGSSGDGGSSGGNYNPNTTPPPKSPQSVSVGTITGGANATLTTVAKAAETASRGYGTIAGYANQILRPSSGGSIRLPNGKTYKYATGGLADSTGLAWLDGTPSEPEYVLNARQTDAFLKLADVLPSMMNGISTNMSNTFGSTYLNVSVNLESVSPDYDVDRMVDLVKDKLYDSSMYRNNNVLSFLR